MEIAVASKRPATAPASALEHLKSLSLRLLSEAGAANSAAIAAELIDAYRRLRPGECIELFHFFDEALGLDRERVVAAADAYTRDPSPYHVMALQAAVEPSRQELLRRINRASGGVAAIVGMRRDLLKVLRQHRELAAVDSDFAHLLSSWFNPGFLILRQVDWNAPATLLEKLVRYEAVHAIRDWRDLRRRLESDRRCFAFFHPQLPDEPLIFVEVALVESMPDSIDALLVESDAEDTDAAPTATAARTRNGRAAATTTLRAKSPHKPFTTAAFYSISNCEPGLKGISLGNFLIKRVAERIQQEMPRVKHFCTLSPIPGLRPWLARVDADRLSRWPERSRRRFAAALEALRTRYGSDLAELAVALRQDEVNAADRNRLAACAAAYLIHETPADAGDLVARFHLDNGARLERIDLAADLSERRLRESFGVMVNYLYDLASIEARHERFMRGEVAASRSVRALA